MDVYLPIIGHGMAIGLRFDGELPRHRLQSATNLPPMGSWTMDGFGIESMQCAQYAQLRSIHTVDVKGRGSADTSRASPTFEPP